MAGARNLEKDLVLSFELDLLVVNAAGQENQPVHIEQVGLGELGGSFGCGARPSCHAEK
jgi:hypothetical protein